MLELRTRWVAAVRAGDELDEQELASIHRTLRQRRNTVGDAEHRVYRERLIVVKHWYKWNPGEPERVAPQERSAIAEAMGWVNDLFAELRYVRALRVTKNACDCIAAALAGRDPGGPFEDLGDMNDGFYDGTKLRCTACGAEWFRGIGADSVDSTFYVALA